MPRQDRPPRITLKGSRAQLAGTLADVVNVSLTGALIHTSHQQRPGAVWPLILELTARPVSLTARVVRCELAEAPRRDRRAQYALGVAFVKVSNEARAVLEEICGRTGKALAPVRHLCVSLVRCCPSCKSRSVRKEGKRCYRCNDCRFEFAGIRIGVVRFAR